MKLYEICTKLTDEKYTVDIKEYKVLEYEKNSIIKYKEFGWESTMPTTELDKMLIGLLDSKNPSISIYTTKYENIENLKEEMKEKIIETLNERKVLIKQQLDIIKK